MRFKNSIHPGILRKAFLSLLVMVFVGATAVSAQEHPTEHPTSKKATLTKETLADAITDYVSEESNLKGGYFLFFDDQQGKPLALTLDKVHKERLATLGDGVYFACADFKAIDNDIYDLDIFMKEDEHGLEVTEINLHKKNGEARYAWVEKDGIWSKKEQWSPEINQFNASTTIQYNQPAVSDVKINLYDILGRKVETIIQEKHPPAYHQVVWNAESQSSGMYFYRIQAGDQSEAKKMVLLK